MGGCNVQREEAGSRAHACGPTGVTFPLAVAILVLLSCASPTIPSVIGNSQHAAIKTVTTMGELVHDLHLPSQDTNHSTELQDW